MTNSKPQIDERPFQSKSDHAREEALQAHYHSLAIPAVVAALQNRSYTAMAQPSHDWAKAREYHS